MEVRRREVKRLPHHEPLSLCTTRPAYRQGRQLTAVKVYTVNDESQHLIVSGVPALGLQDDLRRLCRRFGDVKSLAYIPDYTSESFVEGYHVQYARIQSARFGKRHIDGRAFFGGTLHVCYAPEMETVSETRSKLMQRRHDVAKRCMSHGSAQDTPATPKLRYHPYQAQERDRTPIQQSCIWNGINMKQDPRCLRPAQELEKVSSIHYGPQPHRADWSDVGVKEITVRPQKLSRISVAPTVSTSPRPSKRVAIPKSLWMKPVVAVKPAEEQASKSKPSIPAVLRLVPSQVKGAQKRIVFHSNPLTNQDVGTGNISLDTTIQSVREKIRAVGVPNIKILLDKGFKIPETLNI